MVKQTVQGKIDGRLLRQNQSLSTLGKPVKREIRQLSVGTLAWLLASIQTFYFSEPSSWHDLLFLALFVTALFSILRTPFAAKQLWSSRTSLEQLFLSSSIVLAIGITSHLDITLATAKSAMTYWPIQVGVCLMISYRFLWLREHLLNQASEDCT